MFGFRAWPTPVARPLMPFIAGGAITFYLISKVQTMGVSTPEALKDPKNPYASSIAKQQQQAHH